MARVISLACRCLRITDEVDPLANAKSVCSRRHIIGSEIAVVKNCHDSTPFLLACSRTQAPIKSI